MKPEHRLIMARIEKYLNEHESERFGQALFNLKINQFEKEDKKEPINFQLRDIYNDTDMEIIIRMMYSGNFNNT